MSLKSKLVTGQVVLKIENEPPKSAEPSRRVKADETLTGHWALDIIFGLILGIFFNPLVTTTFLILETHLLPKLTDNTVSNSAWVLAALAATLLFIFVCRRHWNFAAAFALTSIPMSAVFYMIMTLRSGGAN